jgi:hypothetical protein
MANQQIIEVVAVDKTARALGNIEQRLKGIDSGIGRLDRGFGSLVTRLAGVGAALGAAFGIKKIIQVGSEVEQLELRFNFLFRSVDEGAKAFDTLVDFAARVPFTLQEIQAGAGNLAVISKDAEELGKNLGIVGNVAAVTGLDFQKTAEQIQRSFAGGIAAAEIFRERGVRALLGFQDGVKVTAEETRKRFEEVFGPDGPFGNATLILANSFEGILSMVQDKLFKFQRALGQQGGLFDFAKASLKAFDTVLEESFGGLEEFAARTGQTIVRVTLEAIRGIASTIDFLMPVFKTVGNALSDLINFISALPPVVRELGIIGFFLLGPKGKLVTVLFATVFDTIRSGIGSISSGLGSLYGGIARTLDFLGLLSDEQLAAANQAVADLKSKSEELKTPYEELNKAASKQPENWGAARTAIEKFLERVDEANVLLKEQESKIDDILKKTGSKNVEEAQFKVSVEKTLETLTKQADKIKGMTVDQKVAAELEKIKFDELQKAGEQLVANDKISQALLNKSLEQVKAAVRQNVELEEQIKKKKELEQLEESLSGVLAKTGVNVDALDPIKRQQDKELEILKKGLDEKLITIEDYEKARAKLEADNRRERAEREKKEVDDTVKLIKNGTVQIEDIEALSGKQRVQLLGSIGKDLLGTLGQTNEKAFKLSKAIAIAEAVVNVARGISAALALPFPFNLGAAALVAAQGFAQISAIRGAQYTGPREKGGPVGSGQAYLVGEKGPEMFVPNAGGQIVPNNQMSQPVTVNFNINTVDARDFDTLLVERRGTIVGIINQAVERRGRTGVA